MTALFRERADRLALARAPRSLYTTHIRGMNVREVLRLLADDGWYLDRVRGSHRQFKHPIKRGLVTVAGRPAEDLSIGTFKSILKQAGLKL